MPSPKPYLYIILSETVQSDYFKSMVELSCFKNVVFLNQPKALPHQLKLPAVVLAGVGNHSTLTALRDSFRVYD
jgi:hypothetical protein